MKAIDIVKAKVSPEGLPVPKALLEHMAAERITSKKDKVFQYGDVVFTLSVDQPDTPTVHLYAMNAKAKLLTTCGRFMQDVWVRTQFQVLFAPVRNKTVKKIVERLGWLPVGRNHFGHTIYIIERSKQ